MSDKGNGDPCVQAGATLREGACMGLAGSRRSRRLSAEREKGTLAVSRAATTADHPRLPKARREPGVGGRLTGLREKACVEHFMNICFE